MWTKKGKYGLKALLHLAALPAGTSALSSEIAAAHALPAKFLEAILLELRNAGFIRSRKGKGGGYTMAMPSADVRIGEVVRALEGPLAPIACASQKLLPALRRLSGRGTLCRAHADGRRAQCDRRRHGQHHPLRHA